MKTNLVTFARDPFRMVGFRNRAAVLVACVALGASTAVRVNAVVFDDFENPTKSQALWTFNIYGGTGGQTVSNGHARIYVTPTGNNTFSYLQSTRTWALQEDRTLEFSADVLSSNDDGAVAFFGFYLGDGTRSYRLLVDEDTVALIKRSNNPFALFFLANGAPVKVSNVKFVVSMTGAKSGVFLRFRILDNDNAGAVIFEREFWDTAATDPMQVGSDTPPESYLGQSGYLYVGLYHDTVGLIDPQVTLPHAAEAEVVYDNVEVLEYDVPLLEIAESALLSWSANTEEEQIVVGADSLSSNAVWAPWPEPIFKRFGALSMAVPISRSQQFFKPVPGRQFADDFSDKWEPFTNRSPWMPFFNDEGEEWIVTNGVLQVEVHPFAIGGLLLAPIGTNVEAHLRDFSTSVDILDWETSGTNWSTFSVGARGYFQTSTYARGYIGGLNLNANGVPGSVEPFIYNGSTYTYALESTFDIQQFPLPYRLQFSGVGTKISLRVLSLTTGQPIREVVLPNDSTFTEGWVALWLNGRHDAGDSFMIIADSFFMTGTKP